MAKKRQTSNRKKPCLQIAAFCERVITEKDQVCSVIRMVDRFTVSSDKDELPPGVIPVNAIIAFRAMGAKGRRRLTLAIHDPTGKKIKTYSQYMAFDSDEPSSGVMLNFQIELIVARVGLYWIDVIVGSEVVTTMPLQILYKKITLPSLAKTVSTKRAKAKRKKKGR